MNLVNVKITKDESLKELKKNGQHEDFGDISLKFQVIGTKVGYYNNSFILK